MALRMSAFVGFLLVAVAGGQPPAKPTGKPDPQEKFEPKAGPGAGQKFLTAFVGEWDVEKTFFPRTEGAAPAKSKGTCKQEMIHDGRFLKSEFVFDGPTGKTTGTGTIGFDSATGLFTSTWIDSRQTRMSFRQGKEKFDGKTIVLYSASLGDDRGDRKSKTVTTFDAESKKILHRQFGIAADGTERLVMQLEMKSDPKGR